MTVAVFEKLQDFGSAVAGLTLLRASIGPRGEAYLACTRPRPAGGTSALQIVRLENGRADVILEVDGWAPPPFIQPLPGGRFVVAGLRSIRGEDGSVDPNGCVYGPSGKPEQRWLLGDGVADLQSTPDGRLWVSYSDTGTMGDYGRFGWGRISPELWVEPIGLPGLVRFGPSGATDYRYEPPPRARVVVDCYALNVAPEGAWASYHPGFPLVHVTDTGRSVVWSSDFGPVDSLAVAGPLVLGHTSWNRINRGRLGRLGDSVVRRLGEVELALADGTDLRTVKAFLGRSSALHALSDTAWYRFDLSAVRESELLWSVGLRSDS